MRLYPWGFSTRRIMATILVVALALGGWVDWTGRRARSLRGYRRHGQLEYEAGLCVDDYLRFRRDAGRSAWTRMLADQATSFGLSRAVVEAAARRELGPEERRLLDEHEVSARERRSFGPYAPTTPPVFHSLKHVGSRLDMMIKPGWITSILWDEAEQRRLRRQYEHAINRPWVGPPREFYPEVK